MNEEKYTTPGDPPSLTSSLLSPHSSLDSVPVDGAQLKECLIALDKRAAAQGYCAAGALFNYVQAYGVADCEMGQRPMAEWPPDVVRICWDVLQKRRAELKAQKKTA